MTVRRIVRGLCRSKGYRLKAPASFWAFVSSQAGHRALAFVGAEPRIGEGRASWHHLSPERYSRAESAAEGEQ